MSTSEFWANMTVVHIPFTSFRPAFYKFSTKTLPNASVGPKRASFTGQEYFFQVHLGTKLPTRIMTKANRNKFQSNTMTESTFNAHTMLSSERRIP